MVRDPPLCNGVDLASVTPPPEEEESRVWSYAAAEIGVKAAGVRNSTQMTEVVLTFGSSAGGGRVLRICGCLQDDAVWKRKQNEVEAVFGCLWCVQRQDLIV